MSEIDDAIVRGAELKFQIDNMKEELSRINIFLTENAVYKPGVKTGHLEAHGIKVDTTPKENIKYDQDKLLTVKEHFEFFGEAFKTEYEPISKAMKAFMAENDEFRKAVEWSRTVTPGAPSVKYTKIEE
ncbi:MAG: hypothetical protein WA151_19195 [Desulfatirhabdiaceae bacterium]